MNKSILELYKERTRIRTLRNRYYTIAYFGNYGAQVRQMALYKIVELEEQMNKIDLLIQEERSKLWKY